MASKLSKSIGSLVDRTMIWLGLGLRGKLIIIFMLVKVLPLIFLAVIAWRQVTHQGDTLKDISVADSSQALHANAVENIERLSTIVAHEVASFLYNRDDDLLFLASSEISEKSFQAFVENKTSRLMQTGRWALDDEKKFWVPTESLEVFGAAGVSTNPENEVNEGFNPRPPDVFPYKNFPIYDEITYVGLDGQEIIKVLPSVSTKKHHPLDPEKKNVSDKANTYVKAEDYFEKLKTMKPGEIYVSDVTGAYVRTNFIGMYNPDNLAKAAADRGYPVEYAPEDQAYAGRENPNGIRFEGIVRFATPVAGPDGQVAGYVTMALNHDHIMEFVDHVTPMNERTTMMPSAYEGNYAFIWDYKCRSICHPRHHSIVGFDPETGEPEVPWLESSVYEGWQNSGLVKWTDYVANYPEFHEQSREKRPAAALTKQGLVGLDGRWLNNAPQCVGWMDLTGGGGSGSFFILWSGLNKLNTAAAIPYYTGQYAPREDNEFSRRGFGFVAIGSELEYFTKPARETEATLTRTVNDNLRGTFFQLAMTTAVLIVLVVFIAIWMASFITRSITALIDGISKFRSGERQFRFGKRFKDEFATLSESFDGMADGIEDSIKNPLAILNTSLEVVYMNTRCLDRCQVTLDKAKGQPYYNFSAIPEGSPSDPIMALAEGREAQTFLDPADGRYYAEEANYFYTQTGERAGYIVESRDVTELVQKQLDLETAMNEAKRANEHKGEFLAHMSHEIRTPMNAIIGLSSIVRGNLDHIKGETPEFLEVKDNMRQIESSSLHLLGLLNDILDLSKIEAGKIELTMEPVELKVLANTVVSIMKTRCKEKNINFITDVYSYAPSTFMTDSLHLRQVLINLLGNSVKFTPELGTIEFRIAQKERRDGRALMEFVVRDSGIGISPEAQLAIFKPFEQGGAGVTKQYGGTGLGLTISRHIVNLFGDDIHLKSEPGRGSEFSFTIWLKETEEEVPIQLITKDPKDRFVGLRVLLVDDVDLNRKIAKAMLKVTGIKVDEAVDGSAALRMFEESPVDTYDIILMDVQMPIMDGYQASTAIRSLDRKDHNIPIIALTANAFKEDIDKALEAGMNAHIAKPIKTDKIVEVMSMHLPN
ncbi:MAG: response regulator [Deltaproteobacteria bacterium]|jgi:signal transduction histidine kinase/CheY-like chemotaxis protein|nr:response regulator [Deltaproteobacteria bacterium]